MLQSSDSKLLDRWRSIDLDSSGSIRKDSTYINSIRSSHPKERKAAKRPVQSSKPMQVKSLRLSGLKKIYLKIFQDARGFFFENYRKPLYEELGIASVFMQDNVSFSKKDTIRGLHFQSDPGQAKLISCLSGAIWDVAVDIRPGSPTFGQWEAVVLDDVLREQIFIPEGFAHGFCVLSDTAFVQYKVSSIYNPNTECSIRWNDPGLKIDWPVENPELSVRDQTSPFFSEVFA